MERDTKNSRESEKNKYCIKVPKALPYTSDSQSGGKGTPSKGI